MIINPCKECENRAIGCHAECKEYKTFAKAKEALKAQIRAQRADLYSADLYEKKKAARLSRYK